MILNLGSGATRLEGCVNVDLLEGSDVVLDILQLGTRFEKNSVERVFLFHTIEHIPESKHHTLVSQIWDVLVPGGKFVCSYPEFKICAKHYIDNYKGLREFWKATIYGRQAHPGDFHVTLMDTPFFVDYLRQEGFVDITFCPERQESYNTVVKAYKGKRLRTKEEIYREQLF